MQRCAALIALRCAALIARRCVNCAALGCVALITTIFYFTICKCLNCTCSSQFFLSQTNTTYTYTEHCSVGSYQFYRYDYGADDGADDWMNGWKRKISKFRFLNLEDFYGGRTGPLQCEVQRMRSCIYAKQTHRWQHFLNIVHGWGAESPGTQHIIPGSRCFKRVYTCSVFNYWWLRQRWSVRMCVGFCSATVDSIVTVKVW